MVKTRESSVALGDATPKRGRRLSADRSDVILGTVLDLLKEVGYDQIRMQDVADRAGVGLSTIYRRWPAKQDVVRAALECEQAAEKWVTTGDARADVKSFLKEMAENLTADGAQTLLGFLATLRSDPEVGSVFRETIISGMHEHLEVAAGLGARRRLSRPRPPSHGRPGDPRLPVRDLRPADGYRGHGRPPDRAPLRSAPTDAVTVSPD